MRRHGAFLSGAVTLCLAGALLLPGCMFFDASRSTARAAFGGPSKAKEDFVGDPVAMATIKTIAVIPFANNAPEPGFDASGFATKLANQITSRGEINIVYPQEVLARTDEENKLIRRHNAEVQRRRMLGMKPGERDEGASTLVQGAERNLNQHEPPEEQTEKRLLNPSQSLDDAVKLGRLLKVDAVIMGRVTDYDPYMRPRMSLSMDIVATGQSDAAALALAELTQWGIPRGATVARGVVWRLQQNFDTRDGNIGRNVKVYGVLKHTEQHPYDTDVYLRSMTQFYDYVGAVLTSAMLDARKKAVDEAEMRALQLAEEQRMTQEGMRNRIRTLTNPFVRLPDADQAISINLPDRKDRAWRPDVYNQQNPQKKAALDAAQPTIPLP